ncbi:MAG: AAA family ATPase [Candidatus Lokiarchaeota archaeon]|nr:AAA family ATPase [Candidatus Lokiarchaeota archaeon]
MEFNLDKFFDDYLEKPQIFRNRNCLSANFIPDELPHRTDQIRIIAQIMACTLKNSIPSNLFIYGKTGTGKTAVVKHVSQKLNEKCIEIGIPNPNWLYINCNQVTSGYRVLATICNYLDPENPLPPTGTPRDIMIERLITLLESKNCLCFIILDEIDSLKDKESKDSVLYILTRINENLINSKVNIIGISNILNFKDDLDPRVLSSLCEEEMVFPAYNAIELYDILRSRAALAFQPNMCEEGSLRLCAAIAAKENGDARRALSLLRKCAEIVERMGKTMLSRTDVLTAQYELEKDTTEEFIKNLPVQQKIILLSIYLNQKHKKTPESNSGEIYTTYKELSKKVYSLNALTAKRVADLVKELDLSGVISSRLVSFGRKGGRTRMVSLKVRDSQLKSSLGDDDRCKAVLEYVPSHIRRTDINVDLEGHRYKALL